MIERTSTVLPEPDSPTIAQRPTPVDAATKRRRRRVPGPFGEENEVRRSTTSSRGSASSAMSGKVRVRLRPKRERFAVGRSSGAHKLASRTSKRARRRSAMRFRAVIKQEDVGGREQHGEDVDLEVVLGGRLVDDVPERSGRKRHRQAQECQRSFQHDGDGDADEGERDRHGQHVGQQLAPQDPAGGRPHRPGAGDELPVGERQRRRPDDAEQLRGSATTANMAVSFHSVWPQNASTTMMASNGGKASTTKDPALRTVSTAPPR